MMIQNELGLHARAATKFVQLAAKFPCEVTLAKDGHEVNGKSIMGVLMLVARKGTTVTIRAKGERAGEARRRRSRSWSTTSSARTSEP